MDFHQEHDAEKLFLQQVWWPIIGYGLKLMDTVLMPETLTEPALETIS